MSRLLQLTCRPSMDSFASVFTCRYYLFCVFGVRSEVDDSVLVCGSEEAQESFEESLLDVKVQGPGMP